MLMYGFDVFKINKEVEHKRIHFEADSKCDYQDKYGSHSPQRLGGGGGGLFKDMWSMEPTWTEQRANLGRSR